jgi:hypothetical protein
MHSKKVLIIISILCCNYHYLLSQSVLKGSWEGQNQIFSCWATTLSNLTRGESNKTVKKLPESFFYRGHIGTILSDSSDIFINIADSTFNFRSVLRDSILSFSAIQRCFSYRFSRPIIYSFGYKDGLNGHFVNIYGTTIAETDDISHQNWLNIFDPKPNIIGNKYYKNYKTYSIVETTQYDLQGTHYQFVANRFALPSEIPNAKQKSLQSSELPDSNCLTNTNLRESVASIIQSPAFLELVGSNITFPYDAIPVSRLEYQNNPRSASRRDDSQFVTVESAYNSILMTPLCNGEIKSGIVVNEVKRNCFLIDRIEDLTSFRGIESHLFRSVEREIFMVEHDYRFLYYQEMEQSPKMFIDLDGYFGKTLEKLTVKEFFQKLLNTNSIEVEEISSPIIQPFPSQRQRGFKIKNPR